jgi:hypothetical protein
LAVFSSTGDTAAHYRIPKGSARLRAGIQALVVPERVVFAMSCRILSLAALAFLAAGLGAAEDPDRPTDLQPVAPVGQTRLANIRNYGGGMEFNFALSPDGKIAAMGSHNCVLVYDLSRPQAQQPHTLNAENLYLYGAAVAIAPDGKTVAAVPAQHGQNGAVHFWDAVSGKVTHEIDNDQPFFGLAFSPDGKALALCGQRGLELWDAANGDELRVIPSTAPNNFFRLAAFAPDGRTLATASGDATVQLWEAATGKERRKFRVPVEGAPVNPRFRHYNSSPLTALAFSQTGDLLAVGTQDGGIRLYDLAADQELPPLAGHQGAVRALAFTPDGRRMFSFDADGLRLAWNARRLSQHTDKLPRLSDSELEDLWHDLADADAFHTYRAVRHLSADPKRGLALLRRHIQPVPQGDTARIEKLVGDLQNPNPALRRKAMMELRQHGEAAYAALNKLGEGPRAGNQSIQILMNRLEAQANTPDRQRSIKAMQVLERIGGADAKELVEKTAKGAAGAPLTVAAKAALDRWPAGSGKAAAKAAATVEAMWADLAGDDAGRAYRAIHALAAAPERALPLLREHLKPPLPMDPRQIERWLTDLDSNDFPTRQKAMEELGKVGRPAEAALKKTLAGKPSPEVRKRVEELLKRLESNDLPAELLRNLRALEVLTRLDPREAEPLLQVLAGGPPEDRLTREAKTSLQRLSARSGDGRPAIP